jgi:hypothetical protein
MTIPYHLHTARPPDPLNVYPDEDNRYTLICSEIHAMIRRAVSEAKPPITLMYLANDFIRSELVSKLYITNSNLVSNIEGETTLDESLTQEQSMGALKKIKIKIKKLGGIDEN